MKKKYVSPQQLNEEVNRLRRLSEYAYFNEADEPEEPQDQLSMADFESGQENAPEGAAPPQAPEGGNTENPFAASMDAAQGEEQPTGEQPPAGAEEPTEEIDVTDIVQGTKDTQAKVDEISTKVDQTMNQVNSLLEKLNGLEGNVSKMDQAITKIDSIYKELELMKPPSPEETKEIMAQNSYPFNVTLDKYGKEGTPKNQTDLEQKKNKLSLSNLLSDFNERDVRQSFNPPDPLEDKITRTLPSYRI